MNTHKNQDSFWLLDDPVAVAMNIAPLCGISYCSSCDECIYRHECDYSEYPEKDQKRTFELDLRVDGGFRWVERDRKEHHSLTN